MQWLVDLVKLGVDVAPYVQKLAAAFSQPGGPTNEQLLELATMEAELDNQLANAQPGDA